MRTGRATGRAMPSLIDSRENQFEGSCRSLLLTLFDKVGSGSERGRVRPMVEADAAGAARYSAFVGERG